MSEHSSERDPTMPTSGEIPDHGNVIKLGDEVATVKPHEVDGQTVRVSTRTETMEEVVFGTTESQEIEVTRVPIDRVIDAPAEVRTEGDVVIVPVMEEVAVVETKLVLREELHVRRNIRSKDVELPVTLRKQRAVVERLDPDDAEDDAS